MGKGARSNGAHLDFDLSIAIRAPRSRVFAVLADIQNFEPLPIDAVVKMTKHPASPTRVGTRWEERVRVFAGWWLSTQSVVTDIEEPATIGIDFSSRWFDGQLTYALDAAEDGTTLHQHETLRLRWPLRWFGLQVERKLRSQLEKRLADIRNLLEKQPDLTGLPPCGGPPALLLKTRGDRPPGCGGLQGSIKMTLASGGWGQQAAK